MNWHKNKYIDKLLQQLSGLEIVQLAEDIIRNALWIFFVTLPKRLSLKYKI